MGRQYSPPVHSGGASSISKGERSSMKSLRLLELERGDQERAAIKFAVDLFHGSNNNMNLEPAKTVNKQDKSVNDVLLMNSVMASGYKSGYKSNNNNLAPEKAQTNNMMLFGPTGDNLDSD